MRYVLKLNTKNKQFIYQAIKRLYHNGMNDLYIFNRLDNRYITFIVDRDDVKDIVAVIESLKPKIIPEGLTFDISILPEVYRGGEGLTRWDCLEDKVDEVESLTENATSPP